MLEPKVRRAHYGDTASVRQIDRECWSENLWLQEDELQWYFNNYLEGQFVVELDKEVVGCLFTQRLQDESTLEGKTSKDFRALHSSGGAVVQLLRISVIHRLQGLGLSHLLIEGALQLLRRVRVTKSVVAVTRCSNFKSAHQSSYSEYVYSRTDPTIAFHVGRGAEIIRVLYGFRSEDTENDGHGVLIRYNVRSTEEPAQAPDDTFGNLGTLQEVASDVAKLVMQVANSDSAPSLHEPLLEYGLDSLDFSDLKAELEKEFSIKISSTFLFNYPTVSAVANFIVSDHHQPARQASEVTAQKDILQHNRQISQKLIYVMSTVERIPDAVAGPT